MIDQNIKEVQKKILEIMLFIDNVCRKYDIVYYIMGGTALGAVRHGGFIPWDDDLDIFMTPDNYKKFKKAFEELKSEIFIIQEWSIIANYLEYAKIRMNGTTFIEENFKDRKDMHHGIYVDIMILHKCPENIILQKVTYYMSKYVTLLALSKRNWKPKTFIQKLSLRLLKFLPNKLLSKISYKFIYKYDKLNDNYKYVYFITKAKFSQGIFDKEVFSVPKNILFENYNLMAPSKIEDYLTIRYGDYMKLPSLEEQKLSIHASIYDTEKGYELYI